MKFLALMIIMLLGLTNLAAFAQSYTHEAPPKGDTEGVNRK